MDRKYERLVSRMMFVACLSRGEAEACIRDLRAGRKFSGEAVNHFGGTQAVLRAAWRTRPAAQKRRRVVSA